MSSVGQVAGYAIGGAVGFFAGGNVMLGAQIGGMIGGYIDPPKGQNTVGPQLSERTVQTSTYGADIPTFDGTGGMSGNVFWLEGDEIKEHKKTKKVGGKGGATSKQTTFSYSATFAVGFARRTSAPIAGIRRLWLGNQLVYDAGSGDLQSVIASNLQAGVLFKVYDGRDDQQPDPRMQADKGAANVSGYPGLFYIVFYDLDLTEKYNNTLLSTQVKVEAVSDGTASPQSNLVATTIAGSADFVIASAVVDSVSVKYAVARMQAWDAQLFGVDYYETRLGEFVNKKTGGVDHAMGGAGYLVGGAGVIMVDQNRPGEISSVFIRDHTGAPGFYEYLIITGGVVEIDTTISKSDAPSFLVAKCAIIENDVFFSGQPGDTPCQIYKVTAGVISAISGASYDVQSIGVSESRVFILIRNLSTTTATVVVLSRTDLSVIATYTQSVSGAFGKITVVSDGEFYIAAGTKLLQWINGTAVDLGSRVSVVNGSGRQWLFVANDPDFSVQFLESATNYNFDTVVTSRVLSANVAKLHDMVIAQCARVGLSSSDLDLTELVNSDVRGFMAPGVGSPRTVLEQLQVAFPFDVIPSGYKLKFKSRGGSPVLTIPEADLGAHSGGKVPARFSTALEMPTQVPARVAIKFMNADREYDIDEQDSAFTAQDVDRTYTVSLPLVMTPTEAKQAADVLLRKEWAERTSVSPFSLPPKEDYRKLEAADVIDVIAQGRTHTVRITRVHNLPDGRIEAEGKLTASAAYASTAQAQNPLVVGQSQVPLAGSSELILLDIPRIVSDQDVPGISLGMYGYTAGWPGGVAFRSDDNGESYNAVVGFSQKTEVFTAVNAIGEHNGFAIDNASELTVSPDWSGADLFSITENQLYSYGNLAAYGAPGRWEIVCFKTPVESSGNYVIRNFLRGLYGTEWATGLHVAGDRLVMLDLDAIDFAGLPTSSIGSPRVWRGVTAGASIDSVIDVSSTYGAVNLMPLSPVDLKGDRNPSSFDWTLGWARRTRWLVELFSGLVAPIAESGEFYDVEIWDATYSTLIRVFSGLSSPSVTYSSAHQIADFGSNQQTLYLRLYQQSSTVGRGFVLQQSITRNIAVDPYIGDVTVLMHMDDASLSDVMGSTITLGSVTRSAVQSVTGGYSAYFNGSSHLIISNSSRLDFGTGDFTIELSQFFLDTSNRGIFQLLPTLPSNSSSGLALGFDGTQFQLYCGGSSHAMGAYSLTANAWHHLAVVRQGGSISLYIDYNKVGSSVSDTSNYLTNNLYLGIYYSTSYRAYGYQDELEITKAARYTGSSFAPRTLPYTNP